MLERVDELYEDDKANLGILRIQDSDDHLAPNALNFPAIFSVASMSPTAVTWKAVTRSCTRLHLAWEPALSLNYHAWMLPAFAWVRKADFYIPANSDCASESQLFSVHTSKAAKRSLL